MMRAFFLTAPLVIVLGACLDANLPQREKIGLVDVRAYDNGGTPVVRAQATFYSLAGLVIIPTQPQECSLFSYSPTGGGSGNVGPSITAGGSVGFTVGAFTQQATSATSVNPAYRFPAGTYLDFTAGDSILVSVPGADGGFDPMAVKLRLAEPFTADPVPEFEANQPLELTWEPATTPGSVMVVSLRYNSTEGETLPDLEVACAFADNGSGTVPLTFANGWGTSVPETRQAVFMRVRERIITLNDGARARARSMYEYPLVDLVDAP